MRLKGYEDMTDEEYCQFILSSFLQSELYYGAEILLMLGFDVNKNSFYDFICAVDDLKIQLTNEGSTLRKYRSQLLKEYYDTNSNQTEDNIKLS